MDHITITELRKEIERKRGEPLTDDEYAVMMTAFVAHIVRQGLYTKQAVYKALKRGWMSAQMAHFFKSYTLQ